jgi:hypothetical protein
MLSSCIQALAILLGVLSGLPCAGRTAREQIERIQAMVGTDCQQAISAGSSPSTMTVALFRRWAQPAAVSGAGNVRKCHVAAT